MSEKKGLVIEREHDVLEQRKNELKERIEDLRDLKKW